MVNSTYFSSSAASPPSPLLAPSFKRKTMSITQTYYLAHKARGKLSSEAARPDHNLRLLVGHANLLDSLMLDLADAEREQESWFNQSVRRASPKTEDRHVQWADTVIEEPEEDWDAEDADSDSSSDDDSDFADDDDIEMADAVPLRRVPSHTVTPPTSDEDDDEFDEEEENYAKLTLTRSPSHSAASPPELDLDSDSSEDEHMPPSPPSNTLPSFSVKEHEAMDVAEKSFYDDGYYLPPRNPARLVSAISVY